MKIVAIKALNINSLKGVTEINFELLTKEGALFVITGPTGAGKSTILDIISCALYGRTARLKNPNDLMSRHAGEAYCEVEFEIKGKAYRSSWSQKRARNRHDGKFQTAKMELSDLADSKPLALKSRDVPKKVEELSGLDFGRFTQSMMLAQGGFDAFLKADEKERSSLLEKITGTQIYADISIAIFDKHRSLQQEMDSDVKVLESIELLEENVVEEKQKALAKNSTEKSKTDQELKELTLSLNWVQKLSELLLESQKHEQDFLDATKVKEKHEDSFKKLALANRALNVESAFSAHAQLHQSTTEDKTTLSTLNKELEYLSEQIQSTEQKYSAVKKEFEKETRVFNEQNQKLKQAREIQTQENQTHSTIIKTTKSLESTNENLSNIQKSLSTFDKIYNELQHQIEVEKAYLQNNANDETLVSSLGVIEQTIREYIEAKKELQKNCEEFETLKAKLISMSSSNTLNLQEHIDVLKKHIETLRDKKYQEQLLKKYEEDRASLVENEACFVCGSKEHPFAGQVININTDETQTLIVSQTQELEKKEKELSEYNLALQKQTTLKENLHVNIDANELKLESYVKILQDHWQEFALELNTEALQTQYDTLVERKVLYTKALDTLKAVETKLNKCGLDKKEGETKTTLFKVEIQTSTQTLKELELSLKELSSKRIDTLNVADLDIHEKEITSKFKRHQEKEQLSKSELNELMTKNEERTTYKKSLDLKISKDETKLHVLTTELETLYIKNDFKDAEALKDATLSLHVREELASVCKMIEKKYTQTHALKTETAKKLQEHQKEPISDKPIEELEVIQSLLQQKADTLTQSIGSDRKELELNQENSNKHKERITTLTKKKEAFKVWVKLNELVGSADGTKFKKFAQGITLDQLINLANQHLNILSSRYILARSQEKQLELEVIDAFQGNVIRPVSTLSGGESFIVSLALALGLSELASQKIAIDSLFLDEGFGTLDEESLETALNALNLLQSSGKMVGVISHVEALKERIPLQIKVVPNGDGTSFVEVG